ncbi:MAG: class I SAM-dependent methyltransferase [Bacteriovoracaceae bacterium]|nr:class I SAM-dependent methyltransferase [Bacteriovoracaceae bacterium]
MKKFPANVIWWATHPVSFVRRVAGEVYRKFYPDEPWISHYAVKFCDQHLKKDFVALEWGSGRSTIWFAKRVKKILSVEDKKSWYDYVKNKFREINLNNVDYRFIDLDHPIDEPAKQKYEETPRYVAVAEEFEDESLDLIVVDGHYRQACIQASLPKLKKGGLLLVDNSNWMPREQWGVPEDWEVCHSSFGFDGETTIWKKAG